MGREPITVASDYLAALLAHASSDIAARYLPGYFEFLEKQYILTVPAVWSDKAKDATLKARLFFAQNWALLLTWKQAAQNAGIHPVKLIKEPEAAALYAMAELGDKGLCPGDALLLCDTGGGTVDLIKYDIVTTKPFEVKELVAPTGTRIYLMPSVC